MSRLCLMLAGAIVLGAVASAQQRIDPSRMFPIPGPIKDAGTVDVTTGKWTKASQAAASLGCRGVQTIFKNNCTWTGNGYYAGFESCEWNFDEGRVPSISDPNAPSGAQNSNVMESFQISYCTFVPTSSLPNGYDMEMAFYDKNGGNCAGFVAQQPPAVSVQATAYFDLAGLGLPGMPITGAACWLVTIDVSNTGWVLASDGEGTFDDDPPNDKFIWAQAQNSANSPFAGAPNPDGFIIKAEPATGGYGACSYNIPCGTDALFGNTCGTGLDTWDGSWVNIDGVATGTAGVVLPSCPNSMAQLGYGTNCYFFGGYPANPFASYWLVLKADDQSGPILYCTSRTTSCGSVPTVCAPAGVASIGAGAGSFDVICGLVPDPPAAGPGILIHTAAGRNPVPPLLPFGHLCIGVPFFRGPAVVPVSGGSGNCDASYTWDFGLYLGTNAGSLGLVARNSCDIQPWYREPANAVNPPFGPANLAVSVILTLAP